MTDSILQSTVSMWPKLVQLQAAPGPVQLPEKRCTVSIRVACRIKPSICWWLLLTTHTNIAMGREAVREMVGDRPLCLCTWIQPFLKLKSLGFSIKRVSIVYFPLFSLNSVLVTFLSLATWRSLTNRVPSKPKAVSFWQTRGIEMVSTLPQHLAPLPCGSWCSAFKKWLGPELSCFQSCWFLLLGGVRFQTRAGLSRPLLKDLPSM